VFVITPWARYASQPCCTDPGHVSNFQDPDFLPHLLRDLNKQKFELRKSLAPATVLDGIQLVCGEGSNMEKKVQTMQEGWASDPVHPKGHIYAKMALNLFEKVAKATGPQAATAGGRKRSWSSSNRDEQSPAMSNKHRQGDRFAGGGGSGGSESGCSGYSDGGNRGSGGNAGHTTGRSADWKARGGNSGYGQYGCGGLPYYGGGGNAGSSGSGGSCGGGGDRGHFGRGSRGTGRGSGGYSAGRGGYRYSTVRTTMLVANIATRFNSFHLVFCSPNYRLVFFFWYIKKNLKM
jgi:hypothetical protein